MTSKERIKAVANHKEPDKIPFHINATKWVVQKLKKALNVETDMELLKKMHIDVYDMRGIDIHSGTAPRYIGPKSKFFPDDWAGSILSFWSVEEEEILTNSGWMMQGGRPPLASANSVEELAAYNWCDNDWFDYSDLRERLEKWNDFSIMASGGSVFQHATFLRGMDNLMIDMCAQPEMAEFLYNKMFDFYYEYYRRMFEEVGDMIDVFALADDLGTQNSLLMSPDLFDQYIAPNLKRMADLAHQYDIKLLLHSCGKIESLIPRLIKLGVDILDPIQPECLDPLHIKNEYGQHICLRGGISVQNILSHGSEQEVKDEVKRIATHLKIGGGYIFSPGHPVLQDDVPVNNIITMYEAANEYCRFK